MKRGERNNECYDVNIVVVNKVVRLLGMIQSSESWNHGHGNGLNAKQPRLLEGSKYKANREAMRIETYRKHINIKSISQEIVEGQLPCFEQ